MLLSPLLPDPDGLEIEQLTIGPDLITLALRTTSSIAVCPDCGSCSSRIHSRYTRVLADLPWQGRAVRLELHARRFFCNNGACPRSIFVERVEKIARPFAHKTCRLLESLCSIGFACGGEPGSRLAAELGMTASGATLLRLMRHCPISASSSPTVLGVDDWAWRKGQRYGTILCDLQTHRIVDLLPERSAPLFSSWLMEHPGVQVVSRDRAGCYAQGAAGGAPSAVQVADRFHLVHNLHEALSRAMDRHHRQLRKAVQTVKDRHVQPPAPPTHIAPPPIKSTYVNEAKRARRQERYQKVIALHDSGLSMRSIARQLNMDRDTVRRFVLAGQYPERAGRKNRCGADGFEPYLWRRWQEGCRNVAKLTREIAGQGFTGSYLMVRRKAAKWRALLPSAGPASETPSGLQVPSSKATAWWLLRNPEDLKDDERELLDALSDECPELKNSRDLAQEFRGLVRQLRADAIDDWIERTHTVPTAPELQRFADGLKKDYSAVKAGLSLVWSNGQVEGQINKLKLMKREMYGRAKFDLLRQRLLHTG
jgi:transposase